MPNKVGLLFDGDILLYRAGFSAEKRIYRPRAGTSLDMKLPGARWTSAKSAKADCDRWGHDYKTEVTWKREGEPVENAIHNMNSLIKTIITDWQSASYSGIFISTDGSPVEVFPYIFLTGCGTKPNFREQLFHGYKANRDPDHKPTHLQALKDHLISSYPTIVTQGCEADDYLAQAQIDMQHIYPDMKPVIVTLDKDLWQIPGYKYDFVKKDVSFVTVDEGLKFFFRQMVSGDKADNIPGLKGYGPVKIENLFAKCVTVEDYQRKAHQAYIGSFGNVEMARQAWNMNCDLLWIWRTVPDECPYKIKTT